MLEKNFSIKLLEKISENLGTTINRLLTFDEIKLKEYISSNYKRTDFYKTKPEYSKIKLISKIQKREQKQVRLKFRRKSFVLPKNSLEGEDLMIQNANKVNEFSNKDEAKEESIKEKKIRQNKENFRVEMNVNFEDFKMEKKRSLMNEENVGNLIPKSKRILVFLTLASN